MMLFRNFSQSFEYRPRAQSFEDRPRAQSFEYHLLEQGVQLRNVVFAGLDLPVPSIPMPILSSTTADKVNRQTNTSHSQRQSFEDLRGQARNFRLSWLNCLIQLNEAKVQGSLPLDVNERLLSFNRSMVVYKRSLILMARNGIWNCMEYADFALIYLAEKGLLRSNQFLLHVSSLANADVPHDMYYDYFVNQNNRCHVRNMMQNDRNHDHAFVVITNYNGDPLFVIDLWRALIRGHNAFVGNFDDFINFLNQNPDPDYVRADRHVVRVRDIRIDLNLMDIGDVLLGAHDPEGGNFAPAF